MGESKSRMSEQARAGWRRLRWASVPRRTQTPLQAHRRCCQVCTNRVKRYLFPTDEVRRDRRLVFIADRAGVAAEEVEVDKDRIIWVVGCHIQGQHNEERLAPATPVCVYLAFPETLPVTAW